MHMIADLHIHGRYSQGCSRNIDIASLEKYSMIKGIDLLGTGDFTHPEWQKELRTNLKDEGTGIFKTQSGFPFVLQTEISLIYTHYGKGRKVHNIVYAPDMQAVDQITEELLKRGRVDYDGRPIFKIPCPEFVEMLRDINEKIEVVPAHIWTPWFSMFGANSGYDSVDEAFEDQAKHIHAIETGLSSDPPMNWRLSQLDRFQLMSNSDSHSYWPWRLGREANIFDFEELTYDNVLKAIRTGNGLKGTVEVDPSFGKYHFTGHRKCNVRLSPGESKKISDICPACKKPLTVGVMERVEELADRPEGYIPENTKEFYSLIPLSELLSIYHHKNIPTKFIWAKYNELTQGVSEYEILLRMTEEEIASRSDKAFAEIIMKNRAGKIQVSPGYDGEYGIPQIDDKLDEDEGFYQVKESYIKENSSPKQKGLGDFF